MTSESSITSAMSNAKDGIFLGIDVGGTNVKLGLVDSAGKLHAKDSLATPALGTPQRVFSAAVAFAYRKLPEMGRSSSDLAGIGLAVPGVLDAKESVLREVVNLPGWQGIPLRKVLADVSHLPSVVVNDANSAAYAEHSSRSLGSQSLALITLGTGIGCGLVINGSPFSGDHGCAGELGHIAIRFGKDALSCSCGKRGHLEAYAGSNGVLAQLRSLAKTNPEADVNGWISAESVTPRDIAERAHSGCDLCRSVIDQTAKYIGQAIGQLAQVIDPAVVLLGGAMTFGGDQSEIGRGFLEKVRSTVIDTTLLEVGSNLNIEFASLGNDAGVLGAAMVAEQAI